MKMTKSKGLVVGFLLTILTVAANAGTVSSLSDDAMVTIDREGQKMPATANSVIKSGDIVTVHKGSAKLVYGSCQQTITQNNFVTVLGDGPCSAITPLQTAGKVAKIDPATASLKCKSCTAKLSQSVALGKVALIGGAVVAAAVIADNRKSSPD